MVLSMSQFISSNTMMPKNSRTSKNKIDDEIVYEDKLNVSFTSKSKFESLSQIYEDDEYNIQYKKRKNSLLKQKYDMYVNNEKVLTKELYDYKTRLLNGENLTKEEKKDIISKKKERKIVLDEINKLLSSMNNI